jgi:midasin (ATPase involved in ribosome maturation)
MSESNTQKTGLNELQVQQNGSVPILDINPGMYPVPDVPFDYIEQEHEFKVVMAHLEGAVKKPIILKGPAGVGKTLAVAKASQIKGFNFIQLDCNNDIKRFDIIGRFTYQMNEVKFITGVIANAIRVANLTGQCTLALEEINALRPNIQIALNQLTDWRGVVNIPDINVQYRLDEGSKLAIFGTMNPGYIGTYDLNPALKNRFREIVFDYPNEMTERLIVGQFTTELPLKYINALVNMARLTRKGKSGGDYSYALSPRDLVAFVECYEAYSSSPSITAHNTEEVPNLAWKLACDTSFTCRYENKSEKDTFLELLESSLGNGPATTN